MKIKVTVIATREIEINHEYYEGLSDKDILKEEIGYAEGLFHEWASEDNVQWETTGEIMDGGLPDESIN